MASPGLISGPGLWSRSRIVDDASDPTIDGDGTSLRLSCFSDDNREPIMMTELAVVLVALTTTHLKRRYVIYVTFRHPHNELLA